MAPSIHDGKILERLLTLQPGKIDLGLDRVARAIADCCPSPEFRTVLIGGTNGKGSTGAFLESLLLAKGLRVGLYTSPHLESVRERFRVDGQWVSPAVFEQLIDDVFVWMENTGTGLTFFEALTVVAASLFYQEKVDVALFEVGLGGRLDATNAMEPQVTVLTNVGLDHTEWLGDSLASIAWEKGGITRRDAPLVTAFDEAALASAFRDRQPPSCIRRLGHEFSLDLHPETGRYLHHEGQSLHVPCLSLAGEHQWKNAALAVEAFRLLESELSASEVASALANARHPGRLERLGTTPEFILDGAHNGDGAKALARYLRDNPVEGTTVFVVAVKQPRDPATLFEHWSDLASSWCLQSVEGVPMVPVDELRAALPDDAVIQAIEPDLESVLVSAGMIAGKQGRVVVAGSLYLVGAARSVLHSLRELPQASVDP